MKSEDLKKIIAAHELWLESSHSEGARANLHGANLHGANLRGADLRGANFSGAYLRRANLCGANLSSANLCGANLSSANLPYADLRDTSLRGANLSGANLRCANLRCANFSGANLMWCAGNNIEVKSIFAFDPYPITYTAEFMQIGRKNHKIEDWRLFGDSEIEDWHLFGDSETLDMVGDRVLVFWRKNKEMIFSIIAANPARPTKKEV